MKVHKYRVKVYEGAMDFAHSMSQIQIRLYIPNQGVLGFRGKENIDFFASDAKAIADAENCLKELEYQSGMKDSGQIEIPDKLVKKVISAGKELNAAKNSFQESAKTLINMI